MTSSQGSRKNKVSFRQVQVQLKKGQDRLSSHCHLWKFNVFFGIKSKWECEIVFFYPGTLFLPLNSLFAMWLLLRGYCHLYRGRMVAFFILSTFVITVKIICFSFFKKIERTVFLAFHYCYFI